MTLANVNANDMTENDRQIEEQNNECSLDPKIDEY